MTSFIVLARSGSALFDVERLDINQWILPGAFGRQVIYCDVGLRLALREEVTRDRTLRFDLGVPFTATDEDSIEDLVPVMLDSKELCSLVFGDINAQPTHKGGTWVIDDGTGEMQLERFDRDTSKRDADVRASGRTFSLWTIAAEDAAIEDGTSVYFRIRFHVKKPGMTWSWQRGERRRSHAISDLRVNELRDRPRFEHSPPDLQRALSINRVNGFVINQARLKAGRVSPEPKYVRILEGSLWDQYLMRRLSRKDEPFVATYWTREDVDRDKPFRAFLEVERRRPTSARWAGVTVAALVVAMVLLRSPSELADSVVTHTAVGVWTLVAGLVAAGVIASAVRIFVRAAAAGHWRRLKGLVDRWETFRFRRKGAD